MIRKTDRKRSGFSLVELVVVVLILGIIAAVAAPRMFDTASNARENSTKTSLVVLRDAIELYRAQNSSYPSVATLSTALRPFLKGPFPATQVGTNKNSAVTSTSQNPITTAEVAAAGWVYNETTGDIAINDSSFIAY